jgi:tetratricopeptide (TPR) repeat protein
VNHAIESSVLNLELAFEHRNYLPSLFLFMAPAAGIHRLLKKYQATNRTIRALVAVTISVVIASFGYWTHQRNLAWQTSQSLWRDAMIKAPDQVRPISHVAIDFAWSGNPTPRDYRIALRLFEKSLALQMARKDMRADILGNIGNIYFQMGEMDRALVYQQKALAEGTKNKKLRYDFIKTLVVQSRWEDAERHAKVLTGEGRINEEYYNIHGFILLWQNRPSEALDQFRKALRLAPFKPNIMLNTGKALSLAGSFENAEWFYRLVHKLEPKDPMPYFGMIENSLRWGGQQAANRYAVRLFSVFPVDFIQDQLTVLSNNPRTIPFSSQSIAAPIAHCMKDICRKNSNASF